MRMNVSENRWLSVRETAERWQISERRVRMLCSEGKVIGAVREGTIWRIPSDCPHPADGRTLRGAGIPKELTALVLQIDGLKAEWEGCRPLTPGEKTRLRETFMVA